MENHAIISFTLLTLLIMPTTLTLPIPYTTATTDPIGDKYVRQACSVTTHQSLCIRTLARFSGVAKSSPSWWARAGVSVTVNEADRVARYLSGLGGRPMRGRNRAALSDCVECFGDAAEELHRSLGVLRRLSKGTFEAQMGDLATWLSAALTDTDTCLEGFRGQEGRRVRDVRRRVSRAGGVISNALALVNKLASTGF